MSIYNYIIPLDDYKNFQRIVTWKNEYCLSMRNDGHFVDYYFSIPIYDEDKQLLDVKFEETEGACINRGVNCKALVQDSKVKLILKETVIELEFLSDIEIEATLNGIKVECEKECLFYLTSSRPLREKNNERCFILVDDTEAPIFTISPMYALKEGVYREASVTYGKAAERYLITISGQEPSERVVFEANAYVSKLILDTTVEKGNPTRNNAYGGAAYLRAGEEEEVLFSKFDLLALQQYAGIEIEKAELCVPVLSAKSCELQISLANEPWCSLGITWDERVQERKLLDQVEVKNGYARFNITRYLKYLMRSSNPKNYGFIIKNLSNNVAIVATGDNYFNPQILKIQMKGEK